nr:hypothetical protein [Cellulomonas timonensis]
MAPARQHPGERLDEHEEPAGAGVQHMGGAQLRMRRADRAEARAPPLGRGPQDALDVVALPLALGGRRRGLGHDAGEREHCALLRIGDRAGGGCRGGGERLGDLRAVGLAGQRVGQPGEVLADDHPGVAAGREQGAAGERARHVAGALGRPMWRSQRGDLGCPARDREVQVGAGV